MLIWRRRELENYFLEPSYLSQSKFFNGDKEQLSKEVLKLANEQIYMDAANQVINELRERLRDTKIKHFKKPAEFVNRASALNQLRCVKEFKTIPSMVTSQLEAEKLERSLDEQLNKMTGGEAALAFGRGNWLSLIDGKRITQKIFGNKKMFKVRDGNDSDIKGPERVRQIAKDLLLQPNQPSDFIELKKLIEARMK
ncbi:MAG: hypothetical protein A2600_13510 [Candidatus Lambdaproteobacteria bacterium RIFOXYD1_FULL_56_27]|uniref:Uncharacterized protein n=1 Tax=Candidatus Lambdaproteobacteria bacterium RIFOXYD2_FULL_56_26 TaxID=1817773 RepID=A0A1F6GNZ6_9PROT|nr:MAG: hypothetical protein A2557_11650 [Candidatus Lambdaproteobacteria bacterium RIFOXYD2_FULL_56_26]OGH03885.1 MAG: hypothetical protein A2426_09145 [Candidatus Lambdaproteobacteria bacterium RIFOXYC1_FULL_56_13]OGH08931.1 MAG: hypothetical protein A2600_13510 [Candidatus Lambdaproteobacteria bacterium RIFOXYD1_FULL_56_27]